MTDKQTIFITGAASGIGAATAKHFAAKGWFCGLYDIDEVGLSATASEIGAGNCHVARLDVRDQADWAAAMEGFSTATGGKMDVLFNNAGVGRHGWFEDVPAEDNDWVVDVNVKGVINGVHAAMDMLKATQGARIVNVASTAGIVGSPQLAVYSATKFAVRGFTEALDAEFRDLDISVCSLMPWFVDTPILNMPTGDGSNHNMKDEIEATGAAVYPVSMAAERAWDAAIGRDLHYMVGKDAQRAKFMVRWLPGFIRKQVKKSVGTRD